MEIYKCPICGKKHCEIGECSQCSYNCELEDTSRIILRECWDCRKESIIFSAGGGI